MKKHLTKILSAAFLSFALCLCQNPISAQEKASKAIQFAKGKTSTVVTGKGSQTYTLRVAAGQDCKIQLVSAKNAAQLEVLDAEGMDMTEGSDGRSFEGGFANAGDYRINVTAPAKTAFTLKITVK